MGEYTIYDSEIIDNAVQDKLDLIVQEILEFVGSSNIEAIILTGGFGRGEGGVLVKNNNIKLINDFDINIICKVLKYKKTVAEKKNGLEQLAQELAEKVNIKQVDLGLSHPARFLFTTNKVGIYEYRNGHKVLFGRINVKRKIRNYKAENLPLTDGTQYFLTRGSGLLIAALYFYNKKNINIKDRENFLIETNKAILAIGDSFLLLTHKYHYSYKNRLKIVTNIDFSLAPNGQVLKKLYVDALRWKLKPTLTWSDTNREIDRWFFIRDIFSEFFLWYEQHRLNKNFNDWQSYIKTIYSLQDDFGLHLIKEISAFSIFKPRRKNFSAKLAVLPGLLFSINKNNAINRELLKESQYNINKLYDNTFNNSDWKNTVIKYLNIFHPGGIVKKITAEGKK